MPPTGSRAEFAVALDEVRRAQHLSIRQLARIADVPAATAQGWLSGKHFPTPALRPQYLRLVGVLGLNEQVPEDLFDDPWTAMQPHLRSGRPPYLGLRPFGVGDAPYFFGRAAETHRLAQRLADLRTRSGHGVLALVGPSGSGKSSLLAAGLVAACRDGELAGWRVREVPVAELPDLDAAELDLVVVDQFEDALRLPSRAECLAAVERLGEQVPVVIGLRSDAFAEASQLPALVEPLSAPVLLAPITRAELREVVVGPAELAGVAVDEELVRVLLDDLARGRGGEMTPAALPLLSNALLATWAAGSGDRMTVADYYASGGVSEAVESLAEQVHGSLDSAQQAAAERLFLRLVGVSADAVVREPLALEAVDELARPVMDAFVTARMLTVAGDAVQISHDALLEHWQRLQNWVEARRADLTVLARVRRAAAVWEDAGRDPSALVPVDRLEAVVPWLDDPQRSTLLTPAEREFLDAGEAHFASVLKIERLANVRLRRQRRLALTLTAVTMALALVAGFAFWRARGFQLDAEQAEADAQSRQVAITARSLRDRDPNLVAQLARVSRDLAPTLESASVALDATAIDTPVRWLGEGSAVLAVSPDQQVVARADGGGQITLWRGAELDTSPGTRFVVDPAGSDLYAAEFAEVAGRLLLAVGGIGSRSLWDVTGEPTLVADWGEPGHTTYTAAFSPGGSLLAFGNELGQVELLRWEGGALQPAGTVQLDALGDESFPAVKAVALSGDTLYAGGGPGVLTRWRLESLDRLADISYIFNELPARTQALALSPDGSRLIAGLAGRGVLRWLIEGDRLTAEEPVSGFDSYVNDVSFATDGATFIAGSSDQSARVYDSATGTLLRHVPGPALVTGVGLVGSRPVTTGTDGTLRAWPATSPVLRAGGDTVYNFASDNAGIWLGGGTPYSGIQLWRLDGEPRELPTPVVTLPDRDRQVGAVGLAGDASYVVGGSANGRVISWPLTEDGAGEASVVKVSDAYIAFTPVSPDGSLVAAMEYQGEYTHLLRAGPQGLLTKVATLDTPFPQLMAFSPDSSLLAVALAGDRVDVWSVADPAEPWLVSSLEMPTVPGSVGFGGSPPLLAVGLDSGVVQVWDLTDPEAPVKQREFGDARSGVDAVSFRPDASMLLAASGDDRIWGWDLTSDASTAALSVDGALGSPWDVRVVSGGAGFVASGSTGMVRLWRLDLAEADDWLCGVRGDPLTPEEWYRHLPGVEPKDPCRVER
jgi:WD40 repeat protein